MISISVVFNLDVFDKAVRNPRWRIQDGLSLKILTQFPRHVAYSKNDEDLKENLIYPLSFLVIFLTLSELWKGGGGLPEE